jgi:hypothetical protein
LGWRKLNGPIPADIHGIWMQKCWMKTKKHLSCGFSMLWPLASFVKAPNAERAGARSTYITRKGRSNGIEERRAE